METTLRNKLVFLSVEPSPQSCDLVIFVRKKKPKKKKLDKTEKGSYLPKIQKEQRTQ